MSFGQVEMFDNVGGGFNDATALLIIMLCRDIYSL